MIDLSRTRLIKDFSLEVAMHQGVLKMEEQSIYDVTIVGGGPVGLFATFYSGMRELKTRVIESLPYLGGKVAYFYPEKMIRDIGGIQSLTGDELTANLVAQAETFSPEFVLGQQVTDVKRHKDGYFILNDSAGTKHLTKTIILATGFGSLQPVELNHPKANQYAETSMHYSIHDLAQFKNKRIVISGGGDAAVDWANELQPIAKHVTLIYRKENFKGIESNVTKMKKAGVNILTSSEIVDLHGVASQLSSVTVNDKQTGEEYEIELDDLLVNHGFHIDLGPIQEWGMKMTDAGISVDASMTTSIPGIYAIGDIADYNHKLPLIAGGFNEGPIAVNSAKKYIRPDETLSTIFSTNYEPLLERDEG